MRKCSSLSEANRPWLRRLVCCILPVISAPAFCAVTSPPEVTSSEIEAAYLYNFAKFVRWPAGSILPSAPFTICLLGDDGFGAVIDSLIADETIQGHKIVARRLSSVLTAGSCQILFLAPSEEPRLSRDLEQIEKKPVLTVSNIPKFLEHAGMVQLLVQNNRVRFAVNLTVAQQSGLTLSSELLKVAVYVDSKPIPEAK